VIHLSLPLEVVKELKKQRLENLDDDTEGRLYIFKIVLSTHMKKQGERTGL